MSALQNRRFTLIKRPTGMAQRTDFEYSTVPAGEPGPGEALLRVLYLSLDPAMRGWMNESRSYIAPVGLGEVMRAIGLGRVVASNDPMLKPGNFATGLTGVQDYAVVAAKSLNKVDPQLAPLPRYLSALGGTGLTAYFGLLEVGQPKPGETVVPSSANRPPSTRREPCHTPLGTRACTCISASISGPHTRFGTSDTNSCLIFNIRPSTRYSDL